jgi:Putative DNA-binding domain
MALGSFSRGALYELTLDDVNRMLEVDESLFVEHKAGIGETESFKLLQAVAAFANTAGGWVLFGVENRRVVADRDAPWARSDAPPLVDMLRDRLRGRVDPLPAFEAKVMPVPSRRPRRGGSRLRIVGHPAHRCSEQRRIRP